MQFAHPLGGDGESLLLPLCHSAVSSASWPAIIPCLKADLSTMLYRSISSRAIRLDSGRVRVG